mgnify:CR=1 FL=1
MENIYKSINLNKELNSYYKKFKLNKYKFNWVSFLLLILALVFLPFAIKVNRLFYIVVIVFLVVAIFINRKFSLKKKMTYCNFIEEKLKEEAKNKNMLLLNEIYPLYLNVNDETKMFEIYLDNEKILSTKYSNLKNYIIYNNSKEYKASLRLPNTPTSYIKKYLLEINTKDGNSITLTFFNNNIKFIVGNKIFYQQFTNTKTINSLAQILDKIFSLNKK